MPVIWLLCDDLLFASRMTGPAKDVGATVRQARDMTTILKWAEADVPALVILDLANGTLAVGDAVSAIKKWEPPPRVVAFGAHVDVDRLRAARDAGCDLVLPRSAFAERVNGELSEWMGRSV